MAEKNKDGLHCDLCGCSGPAVRCDKCNGQIFCLSCDDMYHRHPKRRFHLRKAVDSVASAGSLRPASGNKSVAPGDPSKMPIPPPRKKKFFRSNRGPQQNEVPMLPKKEFSLTEKIGNIRRFMTNRPLPPVPKIDDNERTQFRSRAESPQSSDIKQTNARGGLQDRHLKVSSSLSTGPHYQNILTHLTKMAENTSDDWDDSHSASGSTRGSSIGDDMSWGQDVKMLNASSNPPLLKSRGNVSTQEIWHNNNNNIQGFGTLRRNHPQHGCAMPGTTMQQTRGMHHSASVSDLTSINRNVPQSPLSPFAYPYPSGFAPPFSPFAPANSVGHLNYPHGFGESWNNLQEDGRHYEGDANTMTRDNRRQSVDSQMKRSQSVMYDPMTMPAPFFPFGGPMSPYPPYPYWAYQHHMSMPPSPSSSVRSLSRLGRTHRRFRDEESVSSSHSSRKGTPSRKQEKMRHKSSSDDEEGEADDQHAQLDLNQSRAEDFSDSSKSSREDESDSSIPLAAAETPTTQWECCFCTFINPAGTRICNICCKTATVTEGRSSKKANPLKKQTNKVASLQKHHNSPSEKSDVSVQFTDSLVKEQLQIEKEIRRRISQEQKSNEESHGVQQVVTEEVTAPEIPEWNANTESPTPLHCHHPQNQNSNLVLHSSHSQIIPNPNLPQKSLAEISCQTNYVATRSEEIITDSSQKNSASADNLEKKHTLEIKTVFKKEMCSIALSTDDHPDNAFTKSDNLNMEIKKEPHITKSIGVETENSNINENGATSKVNCVISNVPTSEEVHSAQNRKTSNVASNTDDLRNVDLKDKDKENLSTVNKEISQNKHTAKNRILQKMSSVASGTDDLHELSIGHDTRGSSVDRTSPSSQSIYTQTLPNRDGRLYRSYSHTSLRGDAMFGRKRENRFNSDFNHLQYGTPFYRSSSRASLISEPGFIPLNKKNAFSQLQNPDQFGKSWGLHDKIPPQFTNNYHRKSRMTNGWGDKYGPQKQNFYLSMEELVEHRKQETMRAQGLEMVRMIRKAEQAGFMADDLQVALNHCGMQDPTEWLEENWKHMIETVVTLATNFGHDKPDNDVGIVSVGEAKEALRMHKGNVWAAVTECVESRQRKFIELNTRIKCSRKEIIASLTANQGDMEATYSDLTKPSFKPYSSHSFEPSSGGENNEPHFMSDPDDIPDSASTMDMWLMKRNHWRHDTADFFLKRPSLITDYPRGKFLSRFPHDNRRFSYSSELTSDLASSSASLSPWNQRNTNDNFSLSHPEYANDLVDDSSASTSSSNGVFSNGYEKKQRKIAGMSQEDIFREYKRMHLRNTRGHFLPEYDRSNLKMGSNEPFLEDYNTVKKNSKMSKKPGNHAKLLHKNNESINPNFQKNQMIKENSIHQTIAGAFELPVHHDDVQDTAVDLTKKVIETEPQQNHCNELTESNIGTNSLHQLEQQKQLTLKTKDKTGTDHDNSEQENVNEEFQENQIKSSQHNKGAPRFYEQFRKMEAQQNHYQVHKESAMQRIEETTNKNKKHAPKFLRKLAALQKRDKKSTSPVIDAERKYQQEVNKYEDEDDEEIQYPVYQNIEIFANSINKKPPKSKGFLSRLTNAYKSKTHSHNDVTKTDGSVKGNIKGKHVEMSSIPNTEHMTLKASALSTEKVQVPLPSFSDSPETLKKKPGILQRLGLLNTSNTSLNEIVTNNAGAHTDENLKLSEIFSLQQSLLSYTTAEKYLNEKEKITTELINEPLHNEYPSIMFSSSKYHVPAGIAENNKQLISTVNNDEHEYFTSELAKQEMVRGNIHDENLINVSLNNEHVDAYQPLEDKLITSEGTSSLKNEIDKKRDYTHIEQTAQEPSESNNFTTDGESNMYSSTNLDTIDTKTCEPTIVTSESTAFTPATATAGGVKSKRRERAKSGNESDREERGGMVARHNSFRRTAAQNHIRRRPSKAKDIAIKERKMEQETEWTSDDGSINNSRIAIKRPQENRTLQILRGLPKRKRSFSRERNFIFQTPVATALQTESTESNTVNVEDITNENNQMVQNETTESSNNNKEIKTNETKTIKYKSPAPVVGSKRLALDKQIKQLLSDGKCDTYEQAEIAAKLVEMKFTEKEALQAAKECPSIYQAISFLQQDCELCAGKFPVAEMISMINCTHRACRECLRAYFTIQIRDRNILELLCPFCNEPDLADEDIAADYFNNMDLILKNLVDAEIHELFHRKVRDRVLMKDPNFRWCSQCSSGFIITNPNQKRLLCPDCKAVTCASCRKPWEKQHEGITCEQFQEWKDANNPEVQSAGLAKHLQENGIDCPNCHFRYSLAKGGCMHFKCLQCQYDFCCGCNKPFKMGQKCGQSNYCSKLGLHAHHPRNCLFYLRDKDPNELQKLLQENNFEFNTEPPEGTEIQERCHVMEQKEVFLGLKDDICGRDVLEGYAGLCRLHYLEYLGGLVKKNSLDPLPIFDNDELEMVLRRSSKQLPPKYNSDTDEQYRTKLLKIIEEEIPL